MTALRKRMIHELELHRKSPRTIEAYVTAVAQLAGHYGRSPDRITLEQIRDFLHYLIAERKLAFSSCNQKLAGIRFFYRYVLGQKEFDLRVPAKRSGKLPVPPWVRHRWRRAAVANWRTCSAVTARLCRKPMRCGLPSARRSARSRPAARRPWEATASGASVVAISATCITVAATGTVRSAKVQPPPPGSKPARTSCCRCPTSITSLRCRTN